VVFITNFFIIIYNTREPFLFAAVNMLFATFVSLIIGTTLGIVFGLILSYGNKYVKIPFRLYVDFIRGLPILVTIFAIYYILGFSLARIGINLTNLTSGIVALSAFSTAQVAEITRGALQTIPKGQIEAGQTIGLRFTKIFIFILFPQAISQMIPPWINTATEITKASTLLSIIGVSELLLIAHQLVATNGRALAFYMFIGLIFFILNSFIQIFGKYLEKRFSYYKT
jgi:polar amino acid transport system permease protein